MLFTGENTITRAAKIKPTQTVATFAARDSREYSPQDRWGTLSEVCLPVVPVLGRQIVRTKNELQRERLHNCGPHIAAPCGARGMTVDAQVMGYSWKVRIETALRHIGPSHCFQTACSLNPRIKELCYCNGKPQMVARMATVGRDIESPD